MWTEYAETAGEIVPDVTVNGLLWCLLGSGSEMDVLYSPLAKGATAVVGTDVAGGICGTQLAEGL